MTDVFALDSRGEREVAFEARLNGMSLAGVEASAFYGFGSGTGQGFMRGGARVGQFLSMAAAVPVIGYESLTGQYGKWTDPYFKEVDAYANDAVSYWTPGAGEVGKAGQIMGGLAEIALPLMAGAGNPTLLIGAQQFGVATDLVREGVDAESDLLTLGPAIQAALLQGAATAVGFKLPFLGKTLGGKMLSGAGGNLITNTAAAAATREALIAQGYEDQAAGFDPADPAMRLVDVLTGLAFGAIAHGVSPKVPRLRSTERAAIATANNAKHFQADTAPGIPVGLRSAAAHSQAMETTIGQLIAGDDVSPPVAVQRASFVPRAEVAPPPEVPPELKTVDKELAEAAKAADVPLPVPPPALEPIPARDWSALDATLRQRELNDLPDEVRVLVRERLRVDPEVRRLFAELIKEAGWDTVGGRRLVADETRGGIVAGTGRTQWLPHADWWPNRPHGFNVKQTAAIIKKALAGERLGKNQQEYADYLAEIAARKAIPREPIEAYRPEPVDLTPYEADTGPADTDNVALVARASEIDEGAVERLAIQFADDTPGFNKAIKELVDAHDTAASRSGETGAGPPKGGDLFGQDTSKEQGLADETRRRDLIRSPNKDVSLETGDPTDLFSAARQQLDFVVQTAERAVIADPDLVVPTGEVDADGNQVTANAADVLVKGEQEIQQAELDAKGFEAAIDCYLRSGA